MDLVVLLKSKDGLMGRTPSSKPIVLGQYKGYDAADYRAASNKFGYKCTRLRVEAEKLERLARKSKSISEQRKTLNAAAKIRISQRQYEMEHEYCVRMGIEPHKRPGDIPQGSKKRANDLAVNRDKWL